MASLFTSKALLLFCIITFCSFQHFTVLSFKFEVGGSHGWTVPPSNDTKLYNEWASKNRFRIDDSLDFKYKKDSVMLVTLPEYKECNTTRPLFFANNGKTEFKLERSGLFYFISGVAGHCEREQKMIVKVMSPEDESSSSAYSVAKSSVFAVVGAQIVLLFLGLVFLF